MVDTMTVLETFVSDGVAFLVALVVVAAVGGGAIVWVAATLGEGPWYLDSDAFALWGAVASLVASPVVHLGSWVRSRVGPRLGRLGASIRGSVAARRRLATLARWRRHDRPVVVLFAEYLLAVAVRTAAVASTPVATPGSVPDGGVVAVSGRVERRDDAAWSPVTETDCVVCEYRVDYYRSEADARLDRRPVSRRVAAGIEAVPFAVAGDEGRVPVDPVPWGTDGKRTSRLGDRVTYRNARLDRPSTETGVVPAETVSETLRDRIRETLAERGDSVATVEDGFLRVTERRLDPGTDVLVVGERRAPVEDGEGRVLNTVGPRHPFLVSVRSRRALLGRVVLEALVALLVVGVAGGAVARVLGWPVVA